MGILTQLLEHRSTLANPEPWLREALAGAPARSGVAVNEQTALRYSAVFAAVRILAETVACLPCILYERLPGRGKERATSHPLYQLLHGLPNPEMTSFSFREALMAHLCLWGNAYAEIEFGESGYPVGLWPLTPNRVTPFRKGNAGIAYKVQLPNGNAATLPARQVLHIPGLGFDGLVGYSPIRMAREAIGLGLATEEFGARFFGEGTHPAAVVEHPGSLSDKAYEHLRESLQEKYSGLGKSHRLLLLEEGMKWQQIGVPPEDAQFLATRKFQVTEIARIYRIPPHMLADLERATFSNIEHQSIEFMVHTIGPWLVRWEQALNWKLLTAKERTRYFVEFLVEGLLRGDTKSRYEAYSIGRQWGWLSANDIRERENMNPIPGGDVYLIPLNMIPASHAGTVEQQRMLAAPVRALTPPEVRATKPGMRRVRAAVSFRTVFEDAARRIVAREARDIGRALRTQLQARAQADFERWLEGYYAEAPAWIGPIMQPAVRALADVIQAEAAEEIGAEPLGMTPELEDHVRGYTAIYAEEHVRHSRTQIAYLLEHEDDPAEAIAGRLEEWQKNRPGKIALKETVQANSVIARFVFASLGVMALRWSALGPDPCPYCRAMDGKVVSMSGFFALGGGSLQPEGQPPMTFGHNVRHPPLHEGCECTVTAAL